jgi:quercetin dioxygenase-like cupin family protein
MTVNDLSAPGTRAAQYKPGATFEGLGMRSTLLELSDAVFRSEVEAASDASGGPLHRHLHQSERFIVQQGKLEIRTGLRARRVIGPGEESLIEPGRPHTFSVVGESATFIAEFTPPLQVADYFLELMALESPGLRDLARLAKRYPREHFYLAYIPPALQRALLRPLA